MFNYAVNWAINNALTGYSGNQMGLTVHPLNLGFVDNVGVLDDFPGTMQPIPDPINLCGVEANL